MQETYKIYYRQYDEDGNEIGRGAHTKEYKTYGWAAREARLRFGDKGPYFKYRIGVRDPLERYSSTVTCNICGSQYSIEETYSGVALNSYIFIRDRGLKGPEGRNMYYPCPECIEKVRNYINILKRGEADPIVSVLE